MFLKKVSLEDNEMAAIKLIARTTAFGMVVVLGVACNQPGDGKRAGTSNPIEHAKEAFAEPQLQGQKFISDCSARPLTALGTALTTGHAVRGSRSVYSFTGANFELTSQYFESTTCEGEPVYSFVESGTFEIKKDQQTAEGAKLIDLKYGKVGARAETQSGVEIVNRLGLCGSRDWSLGKEREVTAQANQITCYNTQVPRVEPNIYKVEGGILYLGNEKGSDRDPQNRPRSLDRTGKRFVAISKTAAR